MRLTALQTRVDADLARRAKEAAAREGEDVSNWLRRLVTRELRPHTLIDAWTGPKGGNRDQGFDPTREAEFLLAPFRDSTNGLDRDFILFTTQGKRFKDGDGHRAFWEQVERRWIFLRSSPTPWHAVGQLAYLDGRVALTLRRV